MAIPIPPDSKVTDITHLMEDALAFASFLVAWMVNCGHPLSELRVRIAILGIGFRPHVRVELGETILGAFDYRGNAIPMSHRHDKNWSTKTNSYAEIVDLQRTL